MPEWIRVRCVDRDWWLRLPLLGLMILLTAQFLNGIDHSSLFSGITLGIHEIGHLLTRPFGEPVSTVSGSLFQVAGPLLCAWLLWRQDDLAGCAFGLFWLGSALLELGDYIGDARAQVIPLVSVGGGEVHHDWAFLLEDTALYDHCELLGSLVRGGGWILVFGMMAAVIGIMWCMHQARNDR